jgi:hypothetical protein
MDRNINKKIKTLNRKPLERKIKLTKNTKTLIKSIESLKNSEKSNYDLVIVTKFLQKSH